MSHVKFKKGALAYLRNARVNLLNLRNCHFQCHYLFRSHVQFRIRRSVSSVVEHSSANPKVPGSIRALSHTGIINYFEACFMHLKREVGNPKNSGLSSQQ